MEKFSVLISVYIKEDPVFFTDALASIFNQTLPPTELLIVKDGPLTEELDNIILNFIHEYPSKIRVFPLEENGGLGKALRIGVENCKYNIIARMDTDDICVSDRFEKQIGYLSNNPSAVLVGSFVEEFNKVPGDLKVIKEVPEIHDQIIKYSKQRNPFNHPSVAFRKSAIINVGSYKTMIYFEDYYLWLRLLNNLNGYIVYNIQDPLLYFRIGNDMIGRRHGINYLVKEINFLNLAFKESLITFYEFCRLIVTRVPLRILPKPLLKLFYKILLR
ncbi:amylovoran biosynthesis protein AmsE [Echinicola strongylocentroti]|uniref:Amylovoran biosynthesis protein AmsE n=1 Tax=Echinicola strongylocentroti TaxID=1795355 RepID=A0A2Z4IM95_9BACT|nr:glycosyltransferase [Echinicola strongylocentroti]AWW32232.1 amylovoran biosynthesis protein AmsE [Echinicola strongylocentroti]